MEEQETIERILKIENYFYELIKRTGENNLEYPSVTIRQFLVENGDMLYKVTCTRYRDGKYTPGILYCNTEKEVREELLTVLADCTQKYNGDKKEERVQVQQVMK